MRRVSVLIGGLCARLLLRRFLLWLALLLTSFAALQIVTLLIEGLSGTQSDAAKEVRIALLSTPALLKSWVPVALTFAALLVTYRFSQGSETPILRAACLAHWQIVIPLALATLCLGLLYTLWLQPFTGRLYEIAQRLDGRVASSAVLIGDRLHISYQTETETQFISGARQPDGSLQDALVMTISEDTGLSTLFAQRLAPAGARILAQGTERIDASGQREANLLLLSSPPAALLAARPTQPIASLPLWQLQANAKQLEAQGYAAADYRILFHQLLALPLFYLAATVAGAAIGFYAKGRARTDRLMFIGAGFAILFYFFDALLGSFGASGWIRPLIAAWVPALTALAVSAILLLQVDRA
jgi:lipopolysaccharide export system permease protein